MRDNFNASARRFREYRQTPYIWTYDLACPCDVERAAKFNGEGVELPWAASKISVPAVEPAPIDGRLERLERDHVKSKL